MKKRLQELLYDAEMDYAQYCDESHECGLSPMESYDEYAADYLIGTGVLVPPCKVGDKIFFPHKAQEGVDSWVDEGVVTSICYDGKDFDFRAIYNSGLTFWHTVDDCVGFFKKEDAEKMLEL